MQENQEFQFSESIEAVQSSNYLKSIIFALLGGFAGIVAWLAPVYFFDYILYITVILVGILTAVGAKAGNKGQGGIVIAIIATLASAVCILVEDWLETAVIIGSFDFQIDSYFEYIDLKFSEDPEQLLYYAGAVAMAAFTGFAKKEDVKQENNL